MVVSNNHLESSDSKLAEVLYIENIMFLLQTIKINFQFTHFMRCVSFAGFGGSYRQLLGSKAAFQFEFVF